MLRNRFMQSPFVLRGTNDMKFSSLTPKVGDIATLYIDENNIQIQVKLEREHNKIWEGTIVTYHPEIKQTTLDERLSAIKSQEKFVNDNGLSIGCQISFPEIKIFGLSRV